MYWVILAIIVACLGILLVVAFFCKLQPLPRPRPQQLPDKQRVWQVPAALVPELAELVAAFEKESIVMPTVDFYTRFRDDREARFLQRTAMQPPIKKEFYMHYEQNKRDMQPYDDKWYVSMGKLIHRHFRDQKVRDEWFHKLGGIRISGNFYYPPGGFREWHTNKDDVPGWRVYYVRVTEPNKSWFNYVDPISGTMYSVADRDGYFNLFDLNSQDGLLWHSVYSDTHRFSLGLHITNEMAQTMISRLNGVGGSGSGLGSGFNEIGEHVMD